MKANTNMPGRRFGRLVVVGIGSRGGGRVTWQCVCDCGTPCTKSGTALRTGDCHSCGCLNREAVSQANTKHGQTHSQAYRSWRGMHQRCDPKNKRTAAGYFLRGIHVCDRWATFEQFIADMGLPDPGESIDRKNNDLGYCPDNCRWATMQTQARNRRSNLPITAFGQTKVLAEWADDARCSVSAESISVRIRRGLSPEDAITRPPKCARATA